MIESSPYSSTEATERESGARSKYRVIAVALIAGVNAFCAIAAVSDSPSWPVAFVAASALAMVGFVCHAILHYS